MTAARVLQAGRGVVPQGGGSQVLLGVRIACNQPIPNQRRKTTTVITSRLPSARNPRGPRPAPLAPRLPQTRLPSPAPVVSRQGVIGVGIHFPAHALAV